ncbi:MAG: pentapeptide repeat-containing protein [Planctomycetes bacterium]|nr:pentapeptide repeat-containing protein [Planctomycetota bacterium]
MKKYSRIIMMVLGAIILAGLIGFAIYHWVTGVPWPVWTGFSGYTGTINKDDRGKTLWDWMGLLIIPLVLAVGAYWFNKTEKENEQKIATDRQREQSLQNYIDKMTELLLEKKLRTSQTEDEVRVVARILTLSSLRTLDPSRKGLLLRFLFEAQLIAKENPICNLEGADLREAIMAGTILRGAHLKYALLAVADLTFADLAGAILEGAILRGADLFAANLKDANLRGAYLKDAHLEHAHLEGANLTGTIMPDGKKYDPAIHHF